jgi:peptide/nickel transport system substrate-binding protein
MKTTDLGEGKHMKQRTSRSTPTFARAGQRAMLLTVVVATLSLMGAGCGSGGAGGSGRSGGFLRFGSALSGVDSTNPFVATNVSAHAAFTQIYPQLVQYSADGSRLSGDFAKSWSFSKDGRTLTMTIVAGAKWTDGASLTSSDAAWTLNMILKYHKGPAAALSGGVEGLVLAEAPNPTTLVLHYAKGVGAALGALQTLWILPEHVWAPHVGAKGAGLQMFANPAPIVSAGPFMLTKFKKEQVVLFRRNPSYYGQAAHIDGFGIQQYSSGDAMLQALKNNELDAAIELSGVEANALKAEPTIRVVNEPGYYWDALGFNSNPTRTSHRELLNPTVRLAMAEAIDTASLSNTLFLGYTKPAATQLPAGQYSDPTLKAPAFDVAAANKLLDGLGYSRGSNGIRVAEGKPMEYELLVPSGTGSAERVAQLVSAALANIGVKATAKILDNSAYWTAVTGPSFKYTQSQLFIDSWENYPDPNFILSLMTCAQRGGLNETGYCNPNYDKLFAEQASATSSTSRKRLVNDIELMLYRERPYSVFYDETALTGWRTGWSDYGTGKGGIFNQLSKLPLLEVRRAG